MQQTREIAEEQAHIAAQSGNKYEELLAEGLRYGSKQDYRKAAKANRQAIARATVLNFGNNLNQSGHNVEAAQRYLEAKERAPVDSEIWARATAMAFEQLRQDRCAETDGQARVVER